MTRQSQRKWIGFIFSLLTLSSMLLVLGALNARAQETTPEMIEVVDAPRFEESCGSLDPDCSKRLLRILTGIHFGEMEVDGGARFGQGDLDLALRFNISAVSIDLPGGDLEAIMFETLYLPDGGGFRVKFSLANSEVMFMCRDANGKFQAPFTGIFSYCQPDEMLGIGGSFLESQWDGDTRRLAMRWAQVNFILNFLRNGNNIDYLYHRFGAYVGASVDTVFARNTPGAIDQNAFALRGNLGLTGMLRTENNRWEIRGFAGFRPNVVAWEDWGAEARAEVLYHMLFHRNVMGTVGLQVEHTIWNLPWRSIGSFASDRGRDTTFIGLMFGLTFQ